MLNVFNRTESEIVDHVLGREVIVPPLGSTSVTERQAPELLKRHPELSLMKDGAYTDAEFAQVAKLDREALLEFTLMLMKGLRPRLDEVVRASAAGKGGRERSA